MPGPGDPRGIRRCSSWAALTAGAGLFWGYFRVPRASWCGSRRSQRRSRRLPSGGLTYPERAPLAAEAA